jgi:hypothetical protein
MTTFPGAARKSSQNRSSIYGQLAFINMSCVEKDIEKKENIEKSEM